MTFGSSLLAAIPGLRHAFFTRDGGISSGIYQSLNGGLGSNDDPARVAENRRRMAEQMDVAPECLLSAHQIHSPDVVVATGPWQGDKPRADALVTRTEGIAIGVTAADCGPILFADASARVIGAAHAGWKGALTGVLESTIDAMEKLGADRTGIVAAIGPLIRQHSYEVGSEFVERFLDADAGNGVFFIPSTRTGHAMFDLAGFIRMRLENAGVLMIDDIGVDTYSDERFYSYSRSVHRKGSQLLGRHVTRSRWRVVHFLAPQRRLAPRPPLRSSAHRQLLEGERGRSPLIAGPKRRYRATRGDSIREGPFVPRPGGRWQRDLGPISNSDPHPAARRLRAGEILMQQPAEPGSATPARFATLNMDGDVAAGGVSLTMSKFPSCGRGRFARSFGDDTVAPSEATNAAFSTTSSTSREDQCLAF